MSAHPLYSFAVQALPLGAMHSARLLTSHRGAICTRSLVQAQTRLRLIIIKRQARRCCNSCNGSQPHGRLWDFYREYAECITDATGKSGITEKIVGRWLAAAVANPYNQTIRREMNPRPTTKTTNGIKSCPCSHHIRFSRAQELLTNSACKISVISEKCGYTTVGMFCRAFRKRFGMTPTEYRERNRNQII